MKTFSVLLIAASLFLSQPILAQKGKDPKFKFGDIKPADFSTTVYAVDSSADAVVLADIGSSVFEGNNKSSFSIVFRNYRRAHILNKNGYGIAEVEVPLYTQGNFEEDLEQLKAVTYNLENGKVVATKLDIKKAVFKDRVNKNKVVKKFTFPNIKSGSIIEFEYRIKSDFVFNLQPWDFQGQYPRLWSEYEVDMPSFYTYVNLSQGYQPFYIKDETTKMERFKLVEDQNSRGSENYEFSTNVRTYRWVMKDVPALKIEGYTSTLNNHIARIEFQMQSIGDPFQYKNVMNTWELVAKDLLDDEDFGLQLKRDNSWLKDEVKEAIKNASQPLDKARNIYAWVRDNFTCTNHNRKYLEQSLKNVLKNRNGNEAELNLLLIAMLRKEDIEADPVMLSTRSHGYVHAIYPMMDRFNYVICLTEIDGKEYFLDASEPGMGFGKLNYECYNGNARVVDLNATPIDMDPASLKEVKSSTVFIINDEKGKSVGSITKNPGYFESYKLRNRIKEKGKDGFLKDFKKEFGSEMNFTSSRIDSLTKLDEPIGLYLEFDINSSGENIIYMNPMLTDRFNENPFKSAKRFYPVEMPYTIDETLNMQMEVPIGYMIDELPKQAVVKFNENGDAMFEYRISASGSTISFRSRLVINRTLFMPDEYENLREFFNFVVKKHNEQIVFKKIENK